MYTHTHTHTHTLTLTLTHFAATGDTRGFEGFVKVGQREMTRVELTQEKLCKMGFATDVALATAKAAEGLSVEDCVELAQVMPAYLACSAPSVCSLTMLLGRVFLV